MWNMPTSSAFPSTSRPSRSSRRRSRRARRSRSRPIRPERDALEIRFPRVEGYRVELPEERLDADFNDDSILELSPDLVGPSITRNSGIIGEGVDLNLEHLGDMRPSHAALPPHPAPALHEMARPRRRAEAPPLRPAQAHHQAMARHLPRLQGRHLSGAAHVSGTGRHGLQPDHRGHHPAVPRRAARSRRCSIPTIPPAPPGTSASTPRALTAGTRAVRRRRPRQLGRPRQRLGGGVLPRRRSASQSDRLRQEPQPRSGSAVPLRLGDAEVSARLHRARGRRPRRR